MNWVWDNLGTIFAVLTALFSGFITGVTFIFKMMGRLERVELKLQSLEDVITRAKIDPTTIALHQVAINAHERELKELGDQMERDREELAQEFTRAIDNVVNVMKEYMRKNDEEVARLRENSRQTSNVILETLLGIRNDLKGIK